jgi:metal-responsive CopG/Arc/MetJ family transcriptional regulator
MMPSKVMSILMEDLMTVLAQQETIRTTVTIPAILFQRSQRFLDKRVIANRNAFVIAALEHFLATLERQEIDQQFANLADDEEYQRLNEAMTESFSNSDWEAFTLAEKAS